MLLALSCVDYTTFFEEDDPYNIIKILRPDVLVKGGDWAIDKIIGGDLVQSWGGKVLEYSRGGRPFNHKLDPDGEGTLWQNKVIGVIPSRYGAQRFPGKALSPDCGYPHDRPGDPPGPKSQAVERGLGGHGRPNESPRWLKKPERRRS